MNKFKFLFNYFVAVGVALSITSCKDDSPTPEPIVATTVANFAADPATSYNPTNGAPIGKTKKFAFFSFKTGALVAHSDSATANWDLGFNGVTIIVNSGTSGPGHTTAFIQSGLFSDLKTAPETGYKSDATTNNKTELYSQTGTDKIAIPSTLSINGAASTGWANYNSTTRVVSPISGKVILVKTGDNRYAKMEILSYYKDAPAAPTQTSLPDYYTFRYVYQPNDSKSFE